eukprot:COSAG01_NODE_199_length_22202_cov_23.993668_28_plen_63_part_00
MLVRDVKLIVEEQLGFRKEQQRLMFNGTELKVVYCSFSTVLHRTAHHIHSYIYMIYNVYNVI